MQTINVPEAWHNWSFQNEYLIDEAFNKYHITDIRALFFQRQLHSHLVGHTGDIIGLKYQLERRIKLAKSEILIQIVNQGEILEDIKIAL